MPEAVFGTIPYFQLPSLHLPLGLEIHPFGVLVAIGVLTGAALAARAARTYGPGDDTPLRDVVIWALVGGIAGAHLLHVLGYHPELLRQDDPFALLKFWDGLSSMGGVVGSLIGIGFFFRWRKISLRPYLDALALGAAPGWAIARIGCIMAHDHPGVLTNFPLAVAYPDGPRHDLGMYDFFVLAILSGILYLLARRPRPQGFLMAVLAIGYSVPRFFLDFLRARDVPFADGRILGLTPAQYIAPVLVVAGIWLLRPMRLQSPSATSTPSPSERGSG